MKPEVIALIKILKDEMTSIEKEKKSETDELHIAYLDGSWDAFENIVSLLEISLNSD